MGMRRLARSPSGLAFPSVVGKFGTSQRMNEHRRLGLSELVNPFPHRMLAFAVFSQWRCVVVKRWLVHSMFLNFPIFTPILLSEWSGLTI